MLTIISPKRDLKLKGVLPLPLTRNTRHNSMRVSMFDAVSAAFTLTGKNRTRSRPQMTNQQMMTSREEPCFDESSIYSRDFFDILGTSASNSKGMKHASAAASIVNAMSMSANANPRYQYRSTQPLVNAKIIRGNRHRLGNPLKGRDVGVVPGTGIGRKHLIGGVWK
ncbi:unnamed protein product [Amoebophrya sp. A120]|nr:unnamed protein product [Amoebophrya sp. A120]|eukprot:GSA120T00004459001.1